jgi:hypothetical protein
MLAGLALQVAKHSAGKARGAMRAATHTKVAKGKADLRRAND